MPVKLYFTTGISNWLCVNSDSVDTQQPITRARGVWVSLWGARGLIIKLDQDSKVLK